MTQLQPECLSVARAAALLDCSPHTVRRLLKTGELPFVKVARLVRIRRTDLDAYLNRYAQTAAAV